MYYQNQMMENLRENDLMNGQDNSSKEVVNTVKDKLETKTIHKDLSLLPGHELKE